MALSQLHVINAPVSFVVDAENRSDDSCSTHVDVLGDTWKGERFETAADPHGRRDP